MKEAFQIHFVVVVQESFPQNENVKQNGCEPASATGAHPPRPVTLHFLQGAPRIPGWFGKSSAHGAHAGTGFAGRQEHIVPVKSEAARPGQELLGGAPLASWPRAHSTPSAAHSRRRCSP